MTKPLAESLIWPGTRGHARAYLQDLARRMAIGQVRSVEHRKALLAVMALADRIPTGEANAWLERVRQGFAVVYASERAQRQAQGTRPTGGYGAGDPACRFPLHRKSR